MADVTLEEVVRRLDTLQRSFDAMDARYVTAREYAADKRTAIAFDDAYAHRISKLEEGHTWMMRGLGALSFGLLAQLIVLFAGGWG